MKLQYIAQASLRHAMNSRNASDWLAAVSSRLQRQWPTIDPVRLDDVALELWRDERLRALMPEQAAEDWLQPVCQ